MFVRPLLVMAFTMGLTTLSPAEDWQRFRGPNGTGVSDSEVATEWSGEKNIVWKTDLPGAGSSSPVVAGNRIFLTCYAGYGEDRSGSLDELKRYLVCVDASTGNELWKKEIGPAPRDDQYEGFIAEHGYASNSATTDGERVYAFFGKAGVAAFDLDGKQLWLKSVGTESSNRRWGTAASLVVYGDNVIVNAAEESRSILALNRETGEQAWKTEADLLELCYATPSFAKREDGTDEMILAVPGEVWGMNPTNGKLKWYLETQLTGNISPSPLVVDNNVFVFGGFRSSGSYSIKVGGKGDVQDSHLNWKSQNSSYVATPVHVDGSLYWIDDRGIAYCVDAASGELVYRERVDGLSSGGRPVYASPIVAGGKIYVVTRNSGTLVIEPGEDYKVVARNKIESDRSDFNASPVVIGDRLLLRSNTALYCIGAK